MDLEPNGEEEQIIDSARGFLNRALPITRLRTADEGRFTPGIRAQLAELGWYGLGLSEEQGGFGLTLVDEMLVFREIGRQIAPLGVLGISLATKIAAAAGQTNLVSALIGGEHGVAIAVDTPSHDGALLFEHEGADLAVRLDDGPASLVPLQDVTVTPLPCLDKSVTMGRATLPDSAIATVPGGPIERAGRLAVAAMLVGICEAVTSMITEYAKIRETFGRPIGAYQAVRHPAAEMAVATFSARCQLFLAAVSARDDTPDADLQIDAAKALANAAALQNVDHNIQLHGGIATTEEHDAHFYLKRANLLARLFGDRLILDRILTARMGA